MLFLINLSFIYILISTMSYKIVPFRSTLQQNVVCFILTLSFKIGTQWIVVFSLMKLVGSLFSVLSISKQHGA